MFAYIPIGQQTGRQTEADSWTETGRQRWLDVLLSVKIKNEKETETNSHAKGNTRRHGEPQTYNNQKQSMRRLILQVRLTMNGVNIFRKFG